jgi:hypothetical protein
VNLQQLAEHHRHAGYETLASMCAKVAKLSTDSLTRASWMSALMESANRVVNLCAAYYMRRFVLKKFGVTFHNTEKHKHFAGWTEEDGAALSFGVTDSNVCGVRLTSVMEFSDMIGSVLVSVASSAQAVFARLSMEDLKRIKARELRNRESKGVRWVTPASIGLSLPLLVLLLSWTHFAQHGVIDQEIGENYLSRFVSSWPYMGEVGGGFQLDDMRFKYSRETGATLIYLAMVAAISLANRRSFAASEISTPTRTPVVTSSYASNFGNVFGPLITAAVTGTQMVGKFERIESLFDTFGTSGAFIGLLLIFFSASVQGKRLGDAFMRVLMGDDPI